MFELSVIVPGNNEDFHAQTIKDLVEHTGEKTEIIAVLDSRWAEPGIEQHPRVNVIYLSTVVGQRETTNVGVRLSKAKYVAKADAHCSFDDKFDEKMLEAFKQSGDNVTMVPVMRNLHAFDWKCRDCGDRTYQDAKPNVCGNCGKNNFKRSMIWKPRHGTAQQSYAFDSGPHFQYFKEYTQREEYRRDRETGLTESMSLQGSFFMATRENYWKLKLSDEKVGSWGNQGIELACKTWLSGGRVLVNHRTWYAHMFRTKADFSFPYKHINNPEATKQRVWNHFFNGKFKDQIHPVSWLVEKFWPITPGTPDDKRNNIGWTSEALQKLKDKESATIKR